VSAVSFLETRVRRRESSSDRVAITSGAEIIETNRFSKGVAAFGALRG